MDNYGDPAAKPGSLKLPIIIISDMQTEWEVLDHQSQGSGLVDNQAPSIPPPV